VRRQCALPHQHVHRLQQVSYSNCLCLASHLYFLSRPIPDYLFFM
jgi:hypothetical protein